MNKRILIIDDETHIRRMIRLTLETAGYDVGEAPNGSQALEMLGNNSTWDVVLLDQKMPGMDGLEVLREIKQRKVDTAVIMVTAFASIELAVDAMKLGATDFVRKPMTPETLRNAVTAALSKVATTSKALQASSISEEQPRSLIQTITMNGFEISRPFEVSGSKLEEPGERRFLVKNPRGWEREVIVEIPDDVVAYAERITRRRLPPENSFWTYRAEHTLATYLWNESRFPDGALTISEPTREELDVAARWDSNKLTAAGSTLGS